MLDVHKYTGEIRKVDIYRGREKHIQESRHDGSQGKAMELVAFGRNREIGASTLWRESSRER